MSHISQKYDSAKIYSRIFFKEFKKHPNSQNFEFSVNSWMSWALQSGLLFLTICSFSPESVLSCLQRNFLFPSGLSDMLGTFGSSVLCYLFVDDFFSFLKIKIRAFLYQTDQFLCQDIAGFEIVGSACICMHVLLCVVLILCRSTGPTGGLTTLGKLLKIGPQTHSPPP